MREIKIQKHTFAYVTPHNTLTLGHEINIKGKSQYRKQSPSFRVTIGKTNRTGSSVVVDF